jgi:hypothetical protein
MIPATFAHAFGQRYELPIPLLLFVLGGAGVVVLSFVLVFRRAVTRSAAETDTSDVSEVSAYSKLWTIVSLVLFAGFVSSGLFGSQEVAENIVPTIFWLLIWIAVPLSCGLLGDWTPRLNPFAQIGRITDSLGLRKSVLGRRKAFSWPAWLGWWPAVAVFFVLACAELIYNQTATLPAVTAIGALTYFAASGFMGMIYGPDWQQRGEVFSVLFSTWGKLGWFRFGSSGRRGFAGGLYGDPYERTTSRITFVMLLLVSVGFDGLLATPLWSRFAHSLPAVIGFGSGGYRLFATILFAVISVAFIIVFYGFAALVSAAGRYQGTPVRAALAGLLPSLLPISFGYLLAHNIEYLMVNGQLLFPLIGNPVGSESWPFHLGFPFNDSYEVHPHLLPSAFYWYLSVSLIIAVHIAAVVLAHRHLALASTDTSRARRSELPWLVAMVGYTMLSLWLLAQPLVAEKPAVSDNWHTVPTAAVAERAPAGSTLTP